MDIKTELQDIISARLKDSASPIFLGRVHAVISEASTEPESLTAAADRVGKMISLFIDKNLGKSICSSLKERIDKGIS